MGLLWAPSRRDPCALRVREAFFVLIVNPLWLSKLLIDGALHLKPYSGIKGNNRNAAIDATQTNPFAV